MPPLDNTDQTFRLPPRDKPPTPRQTAAEATVKIAEASLRTAQSAVDDACAALTPCAQADRGSLSTSIQIEERPNSRSKT